MPVVSEESPKRRGRSLWPLCALAGVAVLLIVGVGLLPLTESAVGFGRVRASFFRNPHTTIPHGYSGPGPPMSWRTGKFYSMRFGSWHWLIQTE
jgi:hypothetical protein